MCSGAKSSSRSANGTGRQGAGARSPPTHSSRASSVNFTWRIRLTWALGFVPHLHLGFVPPAKARGGAGAAPSGQRPISPLRRLMAAHRVEPLDVEGQGRLGRLPSPADHRRLQPRRGVEQRHLHPLGPLASLQADADADTVLAERDAVPDDWCRRRVRTRTSRDREAEAASSRSCSAAKFGRRSNATPTSCSSAWRTSSRPRPRPRRYRKQGPEERCLHERHGSPACNLGALPAHLPRVEVLVDIADHKLPLLRRPCTQIPPARKPARCSTSSGAVAGECVNNPRYARRGSEESHGDGANSLTTGNRSKKSHRRDYQPTMSDVSCGGFMSISALWCWSCARYPGPRNAAGRPIEDCDEFEHAAWHSHRLLAGQPARHS